MGGHASIVVTEAKLLGPISAIRLKQDTKKSQNRSIVS